MKRLLLMLPLLILLITSTAMAELITVTPPPVTPETSATPAAPRPTYNPDVIPMKADMDYDATVEWARARYGYQDDWELPCLEYDPLYIDPVACYGWINHDHGVKDGEQYIIQAGRSTDELAIYLEHVRTFGYLCTSEMIGQDGEYRTFALSPLYADTATIPPVIHVEYLYNMEMLVVRYDHAYGAVNRVWRARELTGEVGKLPASASTASGGTVTLQRYLFTDEAECLNIPQTNRLYNLDYTRWNDWGVQACSSETTFDATIYKDISHWAKYNDAYVLLLEIQLDGAAFDPARCFLMERAPDEGVLLTAPLFWGPMAMGYASCFTIDMAGEGDSIWLAFPPQRYDMQTPLRLYMDLSGSPNAAPLENWTCVDFMPGLRY